MMMDKVMQNRVVMAVVGALAGISLYALSELLQQDILPERVAFALAIFAGVFFTAVLALAGPLRLVQAAVGALGVAVLVTALLSWAGWRFESVDGLLNSPMHVMAAFAVAALPLPFIIAWHGAGVRDYPTLFTAAWGIIVRGGTAFVFTGLVWGVIWLSDTLLNIVGLKVINDLLNIDMVPWLITGATLGVALAVVEELRDYVSPHLILRLVRLLVPVVLVVIVVFCVALPIQGFAGAFDSLSAAGTLITMAGAGAALVSTAIDRDDADATQSPLLAWSTRALAVVLPVPAGLGAYAVWLRVEQYGWTPERLFAGLAALMALAYALFYCVAVLRRGAWMARVRQVNIGMAVGVFGLSVLWLTPVLNAERIAAHSQLARFTAGTLVAADVVPYDYRDWGIAGAELLATLKTKSTEPGQEALAASLQADQGIAPRAEVTVEAIRTALMAELPLQPKGARAARDRILAVMDVYDAGALLDGCRLKMPDGQVGCAMAFADLLPAMPGDEAVVGTYYADNYGNFEVMFVKDGLLNRRSTNIIPGTASFQDDAAAMIAAMQGAMPAVKPAPVNMMTVAGFGLMPMP
jgi:Domain of unknown function (DUF4153)